MSRYALEVEQAGAAAYATVLRQLLAEPLTRPLTFVSMMFSDQAWWMLRHIPTVIDGQPVAVHHVAPGLPTPMLIGDVVTVVIAQHASLDASTVRLLSAGDYAELTGDHRPATFEARWVMLLDIAVRDLFNFLTGAAAGAAAAADELLLAGRVEVQGGGRSEHVEGGAESAPPL